MTRRSVVRLGLWLLIAAIGAAWWFGQPAVPGDARPPARTARPRTAPDGSPVVVATPVTRATVERPDWLRVVPPSVVLRTPGASARRGPDDTPFGTDFDKAIAPWQAGNYAEAAMRLEPLAVAHPDLAESHFYLGTAWLLAGAPEEAVEPLRRAVSLASPALRGEATWYLGLALLGGTRPDEARQAFAEACAAGHTRGCDAARHLGGGGQDLPSSDE
jgi:hypothetical protein